MRISGSKGLWAAAITGLVVLACAGATPPTSTPEPTGGASATPGAATGEPSADRCGDRSRLASQLNFYNWADYMDEAILEQFEEECGVPVVMDVYTSNEEAIGKIQAGNSGYDLVIPTDYAAKLMIDAGLLAPLDMANIPNRENLRPDSMGLFYDPTDTYTLPYQWSTTGVAYNATAFDTPPDSYSVLFEPDEVCALDQKVSMLDDQNEGVGATLQYLGYSWSDDDPAHHEEAKKVLLAQKPCIAGYDSANFIRTLSAGEVVLAQSWGFAAAIARSENPDVHYFIPKEGGIRWQDTMVVPADAPSQYTAEVFINYLLDPEIGAQLTEFTFGFTPNAAAEPLLSDEYRQLIGEGGIAVDDEISSRLEFSLHQAQQLFADTWTAVKSR